MRDQLISLGANRDNTFHNACGAEIPDLLRACPGEADCRFVMVGRLTEKKAPFISLIAFAEVVRIHNDAHIDVVGDGPLKEACIQLCKGLGISSHVTFHGAKPHREALEILSKARCFVQHSVTAPSGDREGTPVGVLEAMGMGLPVVTTQHGGIVDIVDNGITGMLVEEYNMDGMAKAMLSYADDGVLAKQVGDKARGAVNANWTSEKSIGRLWKIIEQTIE
jgi:glycosyltransferase involved in cell wall biosynthesis